MTLPGRPSDKGGLRYELRWTARQVLDVLAGRMDSIHLEPVGEEGKGVEFVLDCPEHREFHQAKRQHAGKGRWSLSTLAGEGVLKHFWGKLADTRANCVFVSAYAADELKELADRARSARSWEDYERHFIAAQVHRGRFETLRQNWGNCPPSHAYEFLKRVTVRVIDEDSLLEHVLSWLEVHVAGTPEAVLAALEDFVLSSVHKTLTREDIWKHLEELGFQKQAWAGNQSVLDAVNVNPKWPHCDGAKWPRAVIMPWAPWS